MDNKHQPHDLKQMQSMPLEAKIIMTQRRIREWYEHWDGMVYVSVSGGKDSTVLKHIVDSLFLPWAMVQEEIDNDYLQQNGTGGNRQ